MRMNLADVAEAMDAVVFGRAENVEFTGASMDSRTAGMGDLFFCLPGSRANGHDFALQALQAGATGIVAKRRLPAVEAQAPVLVVPDTVEALGALGRAWRVQTRARVVGVTGSAGKTTVKEMLAQICSMAAPTCKNYLNRNNQIGLPLSLLSCTGQEGFWVMEAGISRPGDMEALGRVLVPDLALVINVGPAHLEALGDVQGVARAKASLITHVSKGGAALVNQDCAELWQAAKELLPEVHGFSMVDAQAEFFGRRLPDDESGCTRMELVLHGRHLELCWTRTGAPLLENALAAAGAAALLGIDGLMISQGLSGACTPEGRFQVRYWGEWLFIDDTYNANPLSMAAALRRAREVAGDKPLVCVLGDMLELGRKAAECHRELGRRLARTGCAAVLFHGRHAQDVLDGLNDAAWSGRFQVLKSPAALREIWKEVQTDAGVVLFKGSRGGAMETYLEALCTETAP
ncbi:MAG TPA: UDP-N-acetylmuramoyl-tripeptide--D-alanyl-D-alanine ligase [Desulfonatronum sp.]|nr:UDP-N-acetylmuramoyl-tripeptide--D-alanyl-D-alanine ligase [Desulfonatronum sp.]